MKSISSVFFTMVLSFGLLTGCSDREQNESTASSSGTTAAPSNTATGSQMSGAGTAESSEPDTELATYTFHGTPKKIDEANTTVTIDHEVIEGYRDAMTTSFKVADPALFRKMSVGKETHFTIRVAGGQALLTTVEDGHDAEDGHDSSGSGAPEQGPGK